MELKPLVAALVGAASLTGQFVFNRIIFFYVANSEYTAASIITLHLTGFCIGAAAASRCRFNIEALLAAAMAVALIAEMLVWRIGILAFSLHVLLAIALACGLLLAAASGAVIAGLMSEDNGGSQNIFIADAVGSVAGGALGGFWLIPIHGIGTSFAALLVLQGLALTLRIWPDRIKVALVSAAILGAITAIQLTTMPIAISPTILSAEGMPLDIREANEAIIYTAHTPYGLLTVGEEHTSSPSVVTRTMRNNTRALCAAGNGDNSMRSQWQVGSVPMRMLVPASGRTDLYIGAVGLGCGLSLDGILDHASAGSRVDMIEINPSMPSAQRMFAHFLPHGLSDPRVRMRIDDGFGFFATRRNKEPYDAVVIDLAWLQNMNTTHLYSYEMYKNVRANLRGDGILAVWTEDGNPFSPMSLVIYRTIRAVFKNVVVDMDGGTAVFFASDKRDDLANFIAPESGDISTWLEGASQGMAVNRLDDLVLNRYAFRLGGDSAIENVAMKYREIRQKLKM